MITRNQAINYLNFFSDDLLKNEPLEGFINICNKFELTDKDLDNSLNNLIPQYFDLSINSIKEIISIYLYEFSTLGLLDKYKLKIYGGTPHQVICFDAIANANNLAYIGFPDYLSTLVLGLFFNNTKQFNNYDVCMSISQKHCPFNQSKASIIMKNIIPEPNIYWVNGTYCSEAPKTHELLSMLGKNWNTIITNLSHDSKFSYEITYDKNQIKYLANQYKTAYENIYKTTGIKVCKKDFAKAIKDNARITNKLCEIENIINHSKYIPISINEISLFSIILTLRLSQGYEKYEKVLDLFINEIKDRIDNKFSIANKEMKKASCTFIALTVPIIHKEIEEYGYVLTHSISLSLPQSTFNKLHSFNEYEILAELWLRQPFSGNLGQYIKLIANELQKNNIKTLFYGVFSYDRWLGAFEQHAVKALENEYNIKCIKVRKPFFYF
ncbi:MAG: 2-hydroxyacyl-CoA dehydratase [Pleomorphochaeta sp.]